MLRITAINLVPLVVYFSKFLGKHEDFCSKENNAMETFKSRILNGMDMAVVIHQSLQESCYKNYYSHEYCIDQGLEYHEPLIENIVKDSEFSSKFCPFGNSLLDYADSGTDCGTCGNLIKSMDNFGNWVMEKAEGDAFCNDHKACKKIVGTFLNYWYKDFQASNQLDKCLRMCPNEDSNDYGLPRDNNDYNELPRDVFGDY